MTWGKRQCRGQQRVTGRSNLRKVMYARVAGQHNLMFPGEGELRLQAQHRCGVPATRPVPAPRRGLRLFRGHAWCIERHQSADDWQQMLLRCPRSVLTIRCATYSSASGLMQGGYSELVCCV